MPTINWNKSWTKNLEQFMRGELEGDHYGDQWGHPQEIPALQQVVNKFIKPYVKEDSSILEIGSGGGRWTQYFLDCKKLYCVELNPEMNVYLKKRFSDNNQLSFVLTHGADFPGIPFQTIDFAFSFGTLVHLDFPVIREYIKNLSDLMRYKGNISIQFSNKLKPMAKENPDFSDNNPQLMIELLAFYGFSDIKFDDYLLPHSTMITAQYIGR